MTPTLHRFCAGIALALAAAPASAYNVFVDYNTDGIPQTFNNQASGPVSVPLDIVVEILPLDLGMTFLQANLGWGYGGDTGDPGCFTVYGSVNYIPYLPLPDSPPFYNIVPFTCVCSGRCWCESQMFVTADVVGLAAPGLYRLTTLDVSRVGFAENCSSPTYPVATFTTGYPDPRATFVLDGVAVSAGADIRADNWGRVKALYRD